MDTVRIWDPASLAIAAEFAYTGGLTRPGAVRVREIDRKQGVKDHVSVATLWRLKSQKVEHVSQATLSSLTIFCDQADRPDLVQAIDDAIVPRDAMELFVFSNRDWRAERFARFVRQPGPQVVLRSTYAEEVDDSHPSVAGERFDRDFSLGPLRGLQAVRAKARVNAVAHVESECATIVARFRREQERAGHDVMRIDLALWRALEPLLESADSGCMERDLYELAPAELREYLTVALQAESILLRRPPDEARIYALLHPTAPRVETARSRGRGKPQPRP